MDQVKENTHDMPIRTSRYKRSFVVDLMYGVGFTTYVLGFFAGLIIMFSIGINALAVWVFCFIFGTIFLGFGELLEVLTFIANKSNEV